MDQVLQGNSGYASPFCPCKQLDSRFRAADRKLAKEPITGLSDRLRVRVCTPVSERVHIVRKPLTGVGDGVVEESPCVLVELLIKPVLFRDLRSLFVGDLSGGRTVGADVSVQVGNEPEVESPL